MSERNDYNYFDLDNFSETYDSRDYRRSQTRRRQGSYNGRPVYDTAGYRRRRKHRRRTRNRIIIVSCGILIFVLLIVLISLVFRGCGGSGDLPEAAATSSEPSTSATVASTAAQEQPDELSAAYFVTPSIEDDGTNGELQYGIYFWNDAAYELFGGSDSNAENYANTINGFADKLDGITVYDMVIPNHTEMGLPQRLKDGDASSASQAQNIKTAYAALSEKVTPINAYNYLADRNGEYIYFNTDHHWTGLGAYYAYSAFAETLNLPVLSLDDCTEQKIEGFTGSFTNTVSGLGSDTVSYWELPYDVTMDITYEDNTVGSYDSPYYQYAESGANTYGVFIMGDNALTVLKSNSDKAQTDKKIAVVKESYGNAFVPYLTYNYEEVHVIDFRYFTDNLPDYCEENGITEVLFLNGIMSANTQIQLDSMSGLFE